MKRRQETGNNGNTTVTGTCPRVSAESWKIGSPNVSEMLQNQLCEISHLISMYFPKFT